jgi:hypothetical protein
MKRLLLTAALFVCAGCGSQKELIRSCDEAFDLIHPMYVGYVMKDDDLDAAQKKSRIQHAQTLATSLERLAK